ncbi:MAG: guanylate kinase [Chloroflexi bacterium]|nr:guanylate kinase [Chloroflexota bacterium]
MEKGKEKPKHGGLLFVLSGPSGAGKDAVLHRMKEFSFPFHRVVTVTTRSQRPGEKDGVDYHFTSDAEFQEMVQRGELLESAEVYGRWYGTPKQPVKEALDGGQNVILRVDVQGAATIKSLVPDAVLIFLTSPSLEYEERLKQRQTESDGERRLRMEKIDGEMKSLSLFDYMVVNHQGDLDSAVSQVMAIITAERRRVNRRLVSLE